MSAQTAVPDGYMQNAAGHLVPEDQVRDHDKLRDDTARSLASEAIDIEQRLADFKRRALADIDDLVQVAADRYDVRIGGKKGNLSICTFDGRYKIERAYADQIRFTEEVESARQLINQCIERWSEGADDRIRALVDRAFRTDKRGNMRTNAILDLLRLEIEDDEWQRAMTALKDSIEVAGKAVYVRVYERLDDGDQYRPITLNIAAITATDD